MQETLDHGLIRNAVGTTITAPHAVMTHATALLDRQIPLSLRPAERPTKNVYNFPVFDQIIINSFHHHMLHVMI
jgi:hypothetical protein